MVARCPFCEEKLSRGRRICSHCNQVVARFCPYCAEEISVLAELCKYCGERVEPQVVAHKPRALRKRNKGTVAKETPKPSAQPQPDIVFIDEEKPSEAVQFLDEAKYCAWEDKDKGIFRGWWGTFRDANFRPSAFFQKMPTEGGKRKAISYAYGAFLQVLFVMELLALPILAILALQGPALPYTGVEYAAMVAAGAVLLLPLAYVAIAIGLLIKSGFYHIALRLLGGKGSYEATTRVVGYSTSAEAWAMIPYLGGLVAAIMTTVLHYHGFKQVHELPKGRALFAALLPWLIGVGIAIVLVAGTSVLLTCGHCC